MKRSYLFRLFDEAHRLTGHRDFVVIGSLAILGMGDEEDLPIEMALSNDIDCYTKADPDRIHDVKAALGEGSAFHQSNGYFLDPVSPHLPSLPDGWEHRMTSIEQDGVRIWFLDPDDTAVSKYVRSAPNDQRWIRAGLHAGYLSLPRIKAKLPSTLFLDADEEQRVKTNIQADAAWLRAQQKGRTKRPLS